MQKFYEARFRGDSSSNGTDNALILGEAYDFTYDQIVILSYLNHSFPDYVLEDKLCDIVDEDFYFSGLSELDKLMSKHIIVKRQVSDGRNCYAITEDIRSALKKGGSIKGMLFQDCYQELKKVTLPDILVKRWQDTFYESAEESQDGQFFNAIKTLGVEEWNSDIQNAFWALVWQFVNNFTAPFAFQSGSDFNEDNCHDEQMEKAMGELVKMGLAGTLPVEPMENTHDTERYVLDVKVVELLFHGHDEFIRYEEIGKNARA